LRADRIRFSKPILANPPSAVLTLRADGPTTNLTTPGSALLVLTADRPTTAGSHNRIEIPVVAVDREGVAQGASTPSNTTRGLYLLNDGQTVVEVTSSDLATQTVAFVLPGTVDGSTAEAKEIELAPGETQLAGPFPIEFYNHADDSLFVDPSVDTTLEFRAFSVRKETIRA
jgi:hypothetical protein